MIISADESPMLAHLGFHTQATSSSRSPTLSTPIGLPLFTQTVSSLKASTHPNSQLFQALCARPCATYGGIASHLQHALPSSASSAPLPTPLVCAGTLLPIQRFMPLSRLSSCVIASMYSYCVHAIPMLGADCESFDSATCALVPEWL